MSLEVFMRYKSLPVMSQFNVLVLVLVVFLHLHGSPIVI
jgi:hypothetical protein